MPKRQKVIIPKGMINPCEDTIVEIPSSLKSKPIVIVKHPHCGSKNSRHEVQVKNGTDYENTKLIFPSACTNFEQQNKSLKNTCVGTDDNTESFMQPLPCTPPPLQSCTIPSPEPSCMPPPCSHRKPLCEQCYSKMSDCFTCKRNNPANYPKVQIIKECPNFIQNKNNVNSNRLEDIRPYNAMPLYSDFFNKSPCNFNKQKQLQMLNETENLELYTLQEDLSEFQKARRKLILSTSDYSSSMNLKDPIKNLPTPKPSSVFSSDLDKMLSDVKDMSKVLTSSCDLRYNPQKINRAVTKQAAVKDTPSFGNLSDTEEQEYSEVEAALKNFHKARRNLMAKLKNSSSSQAVPILKKVKDQIFLN